jgi:hypothetical protein
MAMAVAVVLDLEKVLMTQVCLVRQVAVYGAMVPN